MQYRFLLVVLMLPLIALGCGVWNQNSGLSEPLDEPDDVLLPTSTAMPTPSPSPTPIRPEPAPSPNLGTPTPFVEANEVYLQERYNGRQFESAMDWSNKFEEWRARRPEHPGILSGIRGLAAALRISRSVERDPRAANDKWAHCMTGAELAKESDLETVEYVAWLKEYQDLVDGLIETIFDEEDFEATIDGAQLTAASICIDCANVCEERWSG